MQYCLVNSFDSASADEALVKLMSENEGITEENNKLKRCAKNMNQEIKLFVLNQSESEDMVV